MSDLHWVQPVFPQQGWQCPICSAVNAPWMPWCPCKGQLKTETATTSDSPLIAECQHQWTVSKTTAAGWHCKTCGAWSLDPHREDDDEHA